MYSGLGLNFFYHSFAFLDCFDFIFCYKLVKFDFFTKKRKAFYCAPSLSFVEGIKVSGDQHIDFNYFYRRFYYCSAFPVFNKRKTKAILKQVVDHYSIYHLCNHYFYCIHD